MGGQVANVNVYRPAGKSCFHSSIPRRLGIAPVTCASGAGSPADGPGGILLGLFVIGKADRLARLNVFNR